MSEIICKCGHTPHQHYMAGHAFCDCDKTEGDVYRDTIAALTAERDALLTSLKEMTSEGVLEDPFSDEDGRQKLLRAITLERSYD